MDAEKRKRDDGREEIGKRAKVEVEDNREETTVTEEEVEEFFTILRRIHVAAKHFGKTVDGAAGRKYLTASKKWRLSFEEQDFEEGDDHNSNGVIKQKDDEEKTDVDSVEALEGNSGLDLNSDPTSKD